MRAVMEDKRGYLQTRVAGDTDVVVRVSGESPRPLILVLTSYEPVRWRLSVTSGVTIDRVILSGYYASAVTSSISNAIRQTETLREPDNHSGYGFDHHEEGRTSKFLLYLQQRFGPITSFSGSFRANRWALNIHRSSSCSFNNMTRSCPVPSAPENGTVNVTGVQPIVAKYSCHEGTLVGSEMRTCLGNGSWFGVEPSCRTGNVCTVAPIRECPSHMYCGDLPSSHDDYFEITCGEDNDCRCPGNDYYDNCTCLPHIGSCLIEKNSDSNVGTPTSYGGGQETTYSCVASDNCNYEVHVIGNYESSNGLHGGPFTTRVAGVTDVVVRVSGESPRPLILVLTSYEPVRWRLSVTSGVTIDRVIMSGYCVGVSSSPSNAIKELETLRVPDNYYGYGADHEVGGTSKLLLYLQQRFGPVTSFSGSFRADRWELNVHRTSGCSFNSMTRSCPVPFAPENGAVNVTGVQPIVTKYSCHVGTLVGPEMRTCLESGWSGEEPFCGPGDTCREGEFRCADGSGTCYPLSFICDGYLDCSDGSDEEHCDICSGDIICGEGEFRCADGSGTCYPLSFICDGYSDCSDGSDEEHCDIFELTSPSDLFMDEGAVESFTICLTVMEEVEGFILREFSIVTYQAVAGSAKDEIDYTLFNQTITFVGNYSLGDSECAVVDVTTIDDNIVEGTEVISVFITPGPTATISIFIIDNDYLEVGFESESLSVSESAGGVEIAVRVFPDRERKYS
ncbi:SCO-spondin [Geodia barretti]|uniref:SCO-spondin n=1 Tax=Geodia barretti TaxID=519541 RepID=A0AA35RZ80_GEOBA|nr:SCO-spondin [Geodia barretti]